MGKVLNPITKKLITIGGDVYNNLLSQGFVHYGDQLISDVDYALINSPKRSPRSHKIRKQRIQFGEDIVDKSRIDKYVFPPAKIPSNVSECLEKYKLDRKKLWNASDPDVYMSLRNVDKDCQNILHQNISRMADPDRPDINFLTRLSQCETLLFTFVPNPSSLSEIVHAIQKIYESDPEQGKLLFQCYAILGQYGALAHIPKFIKS